MQVPAPCAAYVLRYHQADARDPGKKCELIKESHDKCKEQSCGKFTTIVFELLSCHDRVILTLHHPSSKFVGSRTTIIHIHRTALKVVYYDETYTV